MQFIREDLVFCDPQKAILYARKCIKIGTYWHNINCENTNCIFNDPSVFKLALYGTEDETYTLRQSIESSLPLSFIAETMGSPQAYHFRRSTCPSNYSNLDWGQFCSNKDCI